MRVDEPLTETRGPLLIVLPSVSTLELKLILSFHHVSLEVELRSLGLAASAFIH